jgi:hypothetical protein
MNRIAFDVDDVIAAFSLHAHNFLQVPMEGPLNYWCFDTMEKRLGDNWFDGKIVPNEQFWRTLPVLSKPEDIQVDVACYMSSFPPQHYALRMEWLIKHGFPQAPLIVANNKVDTCIRLGITHLVDDKPATIKALQETSVKGIHFINHYCGFPSIGDRVITNLNQINQYI